MAASVVRPRFVPGPVLAPSKPRPPPPPTFLGYGESCFMARCTLDFEDKIVGTFSGYDKTLSIVEEVENACRLHASAAPGTTCGETRLTFLPHYRKECFGQLYFTFEA